MKIKNKKGFVYLAFIFVAVFITLLYAYSTVINASEKRSTGEIAGKIIDIQSEKFTNIITVRIAAQNAEIIVRPMYELHGHSTDCGTLGPIFFWKNKEKSCLPPHTNNWYQTLLANKINQFLEAVDMQSYTLSSADIYIDTTDNMIKARSDDPIIITKGDTLAPLTHRYNPAFAIPAKVDISYNEIKETLAAIDAKCKESKESEVVSCFQSITLNQPAWSTFCGSEEDKLKFKDDICRASPDKDCARIDPRIQVFCYTHEKGIHSQGAQTDITTRFAYTIEDKAPPALITPELTKTDTIEWQHSPDPDVHHYEICIKSKLPDAPWTKVSEIKETDNAGILSFASSNLAGKDIIIVPVDDNNNQAILCKTQ